MDGSVYGTWRQTGASEMRSVEAGFLYDATGKHEFTGVVRTVFTFDPDFQTFTAEFVEDGFEPDQDPTDPHEEPAFSFEGSFTGKRFPPPG